MTTRSPPPPRWDSGWTESYGRKIREKKIAMGHKPDDHEETPQQNMGGMTMGW